MDESPDKKRIIDDAIEGYSGPSKTPNSTPSSSNGLNIWQIVAICVVVFSMLFGILQNLGKLMGMAGADAPREAIEACKWELVATGSSEINDFDWDRGYVRGVFNETNAPFSTQINGEPIKCILIPKHGVDISREDCGLFGKEPENHYACRMVFDREQGVWVPTWKARSH